MNANMLMGSFLPGNGSLDEGGNNKCTSAIPEEVSGWVVVLSEHLQPALSIFGIVGNFLNLTVLTRKKLSSSTILRHCANLCLISLAVSDLLFCCFVFLCVLIPTNMIFTETGSFIYYYTRFSYALINTFIMESTLLIVVMSLERYMAICCPFRPDLYLNRQRVKNTIKISYAFSIVFNIPVWFRFEPVTVCAKNTSIVVPTEGNFTCPCQAALTVNFTRIPSSSSLSEPPHFKYTYHRVNLCGSEIVDITYRVLWAAVGNYIPLILLAYCNISLCRNIYLSHKNRMVLGRRNQSQKKAKSNAILNITLVAIVILFFLLVAPSETTIHIMEMTKTYSSSSEAVLHLMQTMNFSINFFLYCIFDPDFRKVFKQVACCGYYKFYSVSQETARM